MDNKNLHRNQPVPSFEWKLTNICNYRCPYCFSSADNRKSQNSHCSKQSINAMTQLVSGLSGNWLIKLIGGEAMLHPRFFDICRMFIEHSHRLCLTTNFSLPIKAFEKMVSICGQNLEYVTASLHLSQVSDIDSFIQKAQEFIQLKNPNTSFAVTCVMTADNFECLKSLDGKFKANNIDFRFQVLRERGRYLLYPPEIESYLSDKLIENTNSLRGRNFFGTLCHAGNLFFRVDVNGDAFRCYSLQPGFFLGNVAAGRFSRFDDAQPCLARRCTCTVPANRNMICYGNSATLNATVKFALQQVPYTLYSASKIILKKSGIRLRRDLVRS